MPKNLKLNLKNLTVHSFTTTNELKGGINYEHDIKTMTGCTGKACDSKNKCSNWSNVPCDTATALY